MRKFGAVFASLLMLVLPFNSIAQSTSAHVGAKASASVGRGRMKAQNVHFDNWVDIVARHADGTVFATRRVHNIVTNAGFDLIAAQVSGTPAAACNYIAVTNTAITPAATDTTLSGEIDNTNGLGRANSSAGYSHSPGTKTYAVSHVFTAGGTVASQATGLFAGAGAVTMCYEATYTQVTVNSGDTLTVTWTVTLS